MAIVLNRLSLPHPAGARVERAALDLAGAESYEIGKSLSGQGLAGYEPEVFALLCAYIEESPPPVEFLDIGANIGLFSLAARALFGRRVKVTAFEPLPRLATFIKETARRNGLKIELRELALSNREGSAQFYVSSRSDTSNSLNARFRPHKQVIDVQVRTLDGLLADAPAGTYVLKIDTESTEPDVLEGARGFIERHRPAIICEVLAGRTEDRLAQFFSQVSYLPIHITRTPAWDGNAEVKGDQTYAFRDWLFVPGPPPAPIRERFKAWLDALSAPTSAPPASGA